LKKPFWSDKHIGAQACVRLAIYFALVLSSHNTTRMHVIIDLLMEHLMLVSALKAASMHCSVVAWKAEKYLYAYACKQKLRKQFKAHHSLRLSQTRAGVVIDLVLHIVLSLLLRHKRLQMGESLIHGIDHALCCKSTVLLLVSAALGQAKHLPLAGFATISVFIRNNCWSEA